MTQTWVCAGTLLDSMWQTFNETLTLMNLGPVGDADQTLKESS